MQTYVDKLSEWSKWVRLPPPHFSEKADKRKSVFISVRLLAYPFEHYY